MLIPMGLIVISKVLRYKAFIIASALVFSLAFFQTNQSLNESSTEPVADESTSEQVVSNETPSSTETPEESTPPESKEDEGRSVISIDISTNASGDGQSSVNINTTPQIPLEDLERIEEDFEDGNGNLSIDLNTDGDGHSEVDLRTRFRQKTVNRSSIEQNIDREESHD